MGEISWSSIRTAVTETFGDISKWVGDGLDAIKDFISNVTGIDFTQFSGVTEFFKSFGFIDTISNSGDTVKGWLEEFYTAQ